MKYYDIDYVLRDPTSIFKMNKDWYLIITGTKFWLPS